MLDDGGLSFADMVNATSYDVNTFYSSLSDSYLTILQDAEGNDEFFPTSFTLSAVTPEPSSIVLLGTGLLGVAACANVVLPEQLLTLS